MIARIAQVQAVPTTSVTVQVREGQQTESMTVYGASLSQVIQELFEHQLSQGRTVRRKNQLFIANSSPSGVPNGEAPAPQT